jgi:hypothetical protein
LSFNGEEPIKNYPKREKATKMLILHENDLMPRELALTKIWRDDNTLHQEVWMYTSLN